MPEPAIRMTDELSMSFTVVRAMHLTPDTEWCAYCAGHGGYTEHSDALNRMPRRVSCWACHGTGKLPTCPSCKRAVAKDGKEACRFCKVRFAEAISVAP
jgi:DnaJ-class molecular chaperone